MLARRMKLVTIGCMLFGILGGIGMNAAAGEDRREPQFPIRAVVVTINKSQYEQFFAQLREFADKRGFAIRVAAVRSDGEHFNIQMWSEYYKIFATNPFDSGTFDVAIYKTSEHSTLGIPATYLDTLIGDLKSYISKIPKATFSEQGDQNNKGQTTK